MEATERRVSRAVLAEVEVAITIRAVPAVTAPSAATAVTVDLAAAEAEDRRHASRARAA